MNLNRKTTNARQRNELNQLKQKRKQQLSEAKLAANRANAKHSTGPRTNLGKSVSALNSTKFGLTTTVAVLPTEDRIEYLHFSQGMVHSLFPICTEEESLTLEIINSTWRLRRFTDLEVTIHEKNLPLAETLHHLDLLTRLETRVTRNRERSRKMLRDAQKERIKNQISDEANLMLDGTDFTLDMQVRMMGFDPDKSALCRSIRQQMVIEYKEHDDAIEAKWGPIDTELKQRLEEAQKAQEARAEQSRQLDDFFQEKLRIAQELGFVLPNDEPLAATPVATENPPQ